MQPRDWSSFDVITFIASWLSSFPAPPGPLAFCLYLSVYGQKWLHYVVVDQWLRLLSAGRPLDSNLVFVGYLIGRIMVGSCADSLCQVGTQRVAHYDRDGDGGHALS